MVAFCLFQKGPSSGILMDLSGSPGLARRMKISGGASFGRETIQVANLQDPFRGRKRFSIRSAIPVASFRSKQGTPAGTG